LKEARRKKVKPTNQGPHLPAKHEKQTSYRERTAKTETSALAGSDSAKNRKGRRDFFRKIAGNYASRKRV
jgi:hypothetical protein